jgi:hypothetical protein
VDPLGTAKLVDEQRKVWKLQRGLDNYLEGLETLRQSKGWVVQQGLQKSQNAKEKAPKRQDEMKTEDKTPFRMLNPNVGECRKATEEIGGFLEEKNRSSEVPNTEVGDLEMSRSCFEWS